MKAVLLVCALFVAFVTAEFSIQPLPYAYDALEAKGISKDQVTIHYDKHHKGYATKLNAEAEKPERFYLKSMNLTQVVFVEPKGEPIYNFAAQILNHDIYWRSMSPNGGGLPTGPIAEAIHKDFGSFEKFQKEFSDIAVGHFGSGWAWLVQNEDGTLQVMHTHDADIPIVFGKRTILVCDVWEHAFYIDYRNDKAAYVKIFWGLVNWEYANKNYAVPQPPSEDYAA
jgi:Fe-Mn family superoxide dismutase